MTPELCGAGGTACQDCGDLVCEQGACLPGCQDRDGDGYGPGCALGPDCDDLAPGITGPCQANGCPLGWVLIPEGEFVMGCDSVDLGCTGLAGFSHPKHLVYMTPYCIKRTKVTVSEWRACHEAGHCLLPPCDPEARRDCKYSDVPGENDRIAVVGPGWYTARWLCGAWYGGDLPTGAQWEKAARGTDGRAWPWGNEPEPSCENALLIGCGADYNADVEAFAAYSSPFGIPDSYGWWGEWVLDMFTSIEYPPCPEPCVDPVYVPFDPVLAPKLGLWSTIRGYPGWPPRQAKPFSSVAARSYWLEQQQLPEEWGRGISLRCARQVASP